MELDDMELLLLLRGYSKIVGNTSDEYEKTLIREEVSLLQELLAGY